MNRDKMILKSQDRPNLSRVKREHFHYLLPVLIALNIISSAKCFQIPTSRPSCSLIGRVSHRPSPRKSGYSVTNSDRARYNAIPNFSVASRNNKSSLYSVRELVDELKNSESSSPRVVFVGGKGGVGKTTVSSALAVALSSDYESDQKILIVSTDPAHSLGDALDVDLRSNKGKPLAMTDPLTGGRLFACELDPEEALADFQSNLAAFDVEKLADALGVSPALLESLGLREFSGVLNNPPPGLDELVALANVLDDSGANSITKGYDVVIVDTAPTGHTLRLLALPAFLDGFLGKLILLRAKLSGLTSTLQAFFGDKEANQKVKAIDNAVEKLDEFRRKMANFQTKLQNEEQTGFLVVTVPTKLGVAESKRLMTELSAQGVKVTDVIVNQCIGGVGQDSNASSENLINYYERRKSGQKKWVSELQGAIDTVSESEEYQSNNGDDSSKPITLTQLPLFDVELVGVPALAYVARSSFNENPNFSELMEDTAEGDETKFIICGGKGGVGKTTTSSSLAVAMAGAGHNVALISTDPAHSLGDALDMNLAGGSLIDCPLIGMPPSEGSLSVMEVDPASALTQFKGLIDNFVGSYTSGEDSSLTGTLRDLGEVFNTLPAGTDEVVALAKVVELLKKGNFDRIVLDTAPTGHTLRLLSTPTFIAELIDRVLAISQRINSNAAIKMLMKTGGGGENVEAAAEAARSALLSFQLQMYDLEDLFSNPDQTEFLIVTVPTELAVRESIRLLNDLTFEAPDMPIKVRNVVVNQVLSDDGTDIENFMERVGSSQQVSIDELNSAVAAMASPPDITKVPYLDTEPRGVFGLKALEGKLLE